MGMCFGVRNAVSIIQSLSEPQDMTIYGEIVHNNDVQKSILSRGYQMIPESNRPCIPHTNNVIVTAHGISYTEKQFLVESGKRIIDTTCPLVLKIHNIAQKLHESCDTVIIMGKPNHVEVKGIVGDLSRFYIVEKIDEVIHYKENHLGILCQSTFQPNVAKKILHRIKQINKDKKITFVNTICKPTRDRQRAVKNLINNVDALIVVGDPSSNNTNQLVNIGKSKGIPVFLIQNSSNINPKMLYDFKTIGLTAGTSTPDSTIQAVYEKLLSISQSNHLVSTGGKYDVSNTKKNF